MTLAADFVEIEVKLDSSALRRRLAVVTSSQTMRRLNGHIGNVVLDRTKDFLDEMSVTRHKVADRLGAPHSKFYEYASGRLAGSPRQQNTVLENVSDKGSTVSIKNTPGLSRAKQDLHISAKNARALTLPLSRVSHGKRVADLKKEGHVMFRPKGTNILAETRGKGKDAKLRPLYALVKSVVVPKDEGLLPKEKQIAEWATDAAHDFFDAMGSLG